MKKQYKNPSIKVVNITTSNFIAQSYTPDSATPADETTKNGGWNARGAGFSDSDDWED